MRRLMTAAALALLVSPPAYAEPGDVETFDFEGGKITVTEKDTGEKQIAFDGRLLASNYSVGLDRMAEVGGAKVALFYVGDGGNACAPGTLIVWKNDKEVDADYVGDDCGAPSPAVSSDRIVFVPYLLPGETGDVTSWTPEERTTLAGRISYAPQADSTWSDLDLAGANHILDAFRNEDVYKAAQAALGGELTGFATSLSVGGGAEVLPSGVYWSSGCVPHACGISDGFMAVDAGAKKLYFAQKQDTGAPKAWPDAATWPADVRDAMMKAIGGAQ